MVAASSLEIGVLKVAVGGLGGMEVVEVVASTLGVLEDREGVGVSNMQVCGYVCGMIWSKNEVVVRVEV